MYHRRIIHSFLNVMAFQLQEYAYMFATFEIYIDMRATCPEYPPHYKFHV